MKPRAAWAWFLFAALTACGDLPTYDPGPPPAPPVPPPQPPPEPPVPVGHGRITQATYDAVVIGMSESDLVAMAGGSFRITNAGGYRILIYDIGTAGRVAWFFLTEGKVARKATL